MGKKQINLQKLIIAGLFAAMAIILTCIFSNSLFQFLKTAGFNMRIDLGLCVLILGGLILGPYYGAGIGFVADVLGNIIYPSGYGFIPYYTISATLSGFIPGLFSKLAKKNVVISGLVTIFSVYLYYFLTTIWRWLTKLPPLPPMSFVQFLGMRMMLTTFIVLGYAIIIVSIQQILIKSKLKILE